MSSWNNGPSKRRYLPDSLHVGELKIKATKKVENLGYLNYFLYFSYMVLIILNFNGISFNTITISILVILVVITPVFTKKLKQFRLRKLEASRKSFLQLHKYQINDTYLDMEGSVNAGDPVWFAGILHPYRDIKESELESLLTLSGYQPKYLEYYHPDRKVAKTNKLTLPVLITQSGKIYPVVEFSSYIKIIKRRKRDIQSTALKEVRTINSFYHLPIASDHLGRSAGGDLVSDIGYIRYIPYPKKKSTRQNTGFSHILGLITSIYKKFTQPRSIPYICSKCLETIKSGSSSCDTCGYTQKCVICYQPLNDTVKGYLCCNSYIHTYHEEAVGDKCPYCKTVSPLLLPIIT